MPPGVLEKELNLSPPVDALVENVVRELKRWGLAAQPRPVSGETNMCLGIPARVIEIDGSGLLAMGQVDFGGVTREVCLAYVPEVRVDDYVIVHAGFAISLLDEDEAQASIELLKEIGVLQGAG